MLLSPGTILGNRYEIISKIGSGGMAVVYRGRDKKLERYVSVKVLREEFIGDEEFMGRFESEACSVAKLSHPNIVRVYDVGQEDNVNYIVMEYIHGNTLKKAIKEKAPFDTTSTLNVAIQIASALLQAHQNQIIHRDIKPQNILILGNGLVKIADFGIAASLNESELTQTNSVMGSVYYLPPEQASGTLMTLKSDIYSLGIVMFELLTGRLPYKGENAVEIAMKHINDPLPSVKSFNSQVPQSIENIIIKATAKNVKNRYETAREMKEDLEKSLSPDGEKEEVIRHKYNENSNDSSTEVMKKMNSKGKMVNLENSFMLDEDEHSSKANKILISICIVIIMILLGVGIFFMIPTDEDSNVVIPDVSGLTVVEAENKLKELGLEVNLETQKTYSEEIEEGSVVKTEPILGRTVKVGTSITIYESLGDDKILIEDYTDLEYAVVKAKLELLGLKVEKKMVDVDVEEYSDKEGLVIGQDITEGQKVNKNTTIYLSVPDIYTGYPDMVLEKWSEDDVRKWSNEYKLTLAVEYVDVTDSSLVGIVVSQNREAKSKIVSYASFKVVIGQLKVEEPEVEIEPEEEEEEIDPSEDDAVENNE